MFSSNMAGRHKWAEEVDFDYYSICWLLRSGSTKPSLNSCLTLNAEGCITVYLSLSFNWRHYWD